MVSDLSHKRFLIFKKPVLTISARALISIYEFRSSLILLHKYLNFATSAIGVLDTVILGCCSRLQLITSIFVVFIILISRTNLFPSVAILFSSRCRRSKLSAIMTVLSAYRKLFINLPLSFMSTSIPSSAF